MFHSTVGHVFWLWVGDGRAIYLGKSLSMEDILGAKKPWPQKLGRVQHGPMAFKTEMSHPCDAIPPILEQVLLFHLSLDFIDKVSELSERHPS